MNNMKEDIPRGEKWDHGWCYCGLWEKDPKVLENQGVPRGYCGLCGSCGKPGHIMHFPGAVPFTGSWCKFHYYRAMIFHPMGSIGVFLWGAIVIGGVIALVLKIRS